MGRKIPGRKHRGVKDPEKQHQERLDKIKHKVNAPPTNADEQHIPSSLKKLMDLKAQCKSYLLKSKTRRKRGPRNVMFRPIISSADKGINPIYKQNPQESDAKFLSRVNEAVDEVLSEKSFKEKHNLNVIRQPQSAKVNKAGKGPGNEVNKEAETLGKNGKGKKGKKKLSGVEKMSKQQRRKEKNQKKQMKKEEQQLQDSTEISYEHIKFGEVVHEPPTLKAPRKVQNKTLRPGTKELLLKNMLPGNKQTINNQTINKQTIKQKIEAKKKNKKGNIKKTIDKKGKRKDLPNALRRQLDKQQSEIIEAYKAMKKQKNSGFFLYPRETGDTA